MKKNNLFWIFSILVLCVPLILSVSNEPDFESEEDAGIEALLTKYDPGQNGFYTKDNYIKLLFEMIVSFDNQQTASEMERYIISKLIKDFVNKKDKAIFTYEEVLKDLESEEIIEVVASGLQETAESLGYAGEKKE